MKDKIKTILFNLRVFLKDLFIELIKDIYSLIKTLLDPKILVYITLIVFVFAFFEGNWLNIIFLVLLLGFFLYERYKSGDHIYRYRTKRGYRK